VVDEIVATAQEKLPLILAPFLEWSLRVPPELAPSPARDALDAISPPVNFDDAPIVAAAIEAGVDYLVTGDRRLLMEIEALGVAFPAVSPRRMLEELQDD
jgi:hypothetical protein